MAESLAPLQEQLDSILARLAALECGTPPTASKISSGGKSSAAPSSSSGASPVLSAFDDYTKAKLAPFVDACAVLEKDGFDPIVAKTVAATWGTVLRSFLAASTECPKPSNPQDLTPFFKEFSANNTAVDRAMKRDMWDNHIKSVKEVSECQCGVFGEVHCVPGGSNCCCNI